MSSPHNEEDEVVATEAVDIGTLLAENASLQDRLLRALAEAENVRRRADRDMEETRKFAVAEFSRALLPILDNLQRVLDAKRRTENQVSDALVEGVTTTLRLFLQTLERFGIKKIAALGERFDPTLHEALMESADQSHPPGTVTQVLEEGFTIHGRLLRPARVVVAKPMRSDG